MTKFEGKRFTVPRGGRDPKDCLHGWIDAKGNCVFCGDRIQPPKKGLDMGTVAQPPQQS